jgi:2-keto-3-deoxy-L-rhamnonate aldolase RhmA
VRPSFASRLRAREALIGTVISLPDAALAELAAAPFDFVWIDLEHGALGIRELQDLAIAVRAAGCAALVRLPRSDTDRLPAILDAGVDGVVAPRVDTRAEAEALVARLRYPPAGTRGFGPRRAGDYGRARPFWTSEAADPALLVQIESVEGVESISEIVGVNGVDGAVVGCADLSFALGKPLELDCPELRTAVARVRQASSAADVAFGVAASANADAFADLAAGATFVVYSTDMRIYAAGIDAAAAEALTILGRAERQRA